MYGSFVLIENNNKFEKGQQVYLGEVKGKNEAWLRDTLFAHPEIVPTDEIDPTFGPLVPLCKELRTDAGPIDAVFINEHGRLTIVECKLWRNPEARRVVVAQTLDYVSALSGWSYADLQRQVSAALRRQGNNPFDLVRKHTSTPLREADFIDSVSRSLKEGRFLVLLAGDGIREGVQSLTELVNRSATKAFTFAVIEVAVYQFERGRLAIQPRVLAKTELITRRMTLLNMKGGIPDSVHYEVIADAPETVDEDARHADKKHLRAWWQPILNMKFDDPEQEPPKWLVTNNVAISTPFPGIQIKAWSTVNRKRMGVYLTGPEARLDAIEKMLKRDEIYLLDSLPKGTIIDVKSAWPIILKNYDPLPDKARQSWLTQTLNEFANVLRPRLRKWYEETQS